MSKLVIVSNRLPFTITPGAEGMEFKPSSGGLVTAISAYLEKARASSSLECVWVGWPGMEINPDQQEAVSKDASKFHGAHPVFISNDEMDRFYNGFCNKTIWPLFHYFPTYTEYDPLHWQSYVDVNEAFCSSLLEILDPDDTVWIHDYQLFLLPGMLRKQRPNQKIGFFLHIPFPSFEIFRLLPSVWKKQLLEGMLGADLIGFHTHDYTQYFLRCLFRILGLDHHLGQIIVGERLCRADTFPIGIDFEKFNQAAVSEPVAEVRRGFEVSLAGRKAVFSVDRLDYTKGILHRLRGFETFLLKYPEWLGKVSFILVVVPSREEVGQYHQMKQELDELTGRINGRFGRVDWVPILYQYRHLDFATLVALYSLSPIALITPLRDGMNLVAKEYLASRNDNTGILILSEMTGAARELGEAILVNPNHGDELADALHKALTTSLEEQVRRNRPMRERLRAFNASVWAHNFLDTLQRVKAAQGNLETRHLSHMSGKIGESFRGAKRRLLLLDYDGTLVPFASDPNQAVPDLEIIGLLKRLCDLPRTDVYLISGRGRKILAQWFKGININLIAEHGAWIRENEGEWKTPKSMNSDWKDALRPIFQMYVDRLPGSLIEEKEFSVAWHYRKANAELGELRSKELKDDLVQYTANFDVQVLEGSKVVEVRNAGVNKGTAASNCVLSLRPDFILAVGDDQTDEDMFRSLFSKAFTIRVGSSLSLAHYYLWDFGEVRKFLNELLENQISNQGFPDSSLKEMTLFGSLFRSLVKKLGL